MPKKKLASDVVPTLVLERLRIWGAYIKKLRLTQRIQADDLCNRMSISDATLRRIEKGDPRVSVATYLAALHVLGVLDTAVPLLSDFVGSAPPGSRVRNTKIERDNDF